MNRRRSTGRSDSRRRRHGSKCKYTTERDLRSQSSPSWSFGGRHGDELDTLASNNPFYQGGTHRCPQGEELLDHLRRRDDAHAEILKATGRQWKAAPGPGSYRSPCVIGSHQSAREKVDIVDMSKTPSWSLGTSSMRPNAFHSIGSTQTQPIAAPLRRPPTPGPKFAEAKNIVPGPGAHFKRCNSAPSVFSDFLRPQRSDG